jgi:hypothetical protein
MCENFLLRLANLHDALAGTVRVTDSRADLYPQRATKSSA